MELFDIKFDETFLAESGMWNEDFTKIIPGSCPKPDTLVTTGGKPIQVETKLTNAKNSININKVFSSGKAVARPVETKSNKVK